MGFLLCSANRFFLFYKESAHLLFSPWLSNNVDPRKEEHLTLEFGFQFDS
jgi:hypothetical protein